MSKADTLENFQNKGCAVQVRLFDSEDLSKLSSLLRFATGNEVSVNRLRYEIGNFEGFVKTQRRSRSGGKRVFVHIEEGRFYQINWKSKVRVVQFRDFDKKLLKHPVLFDSEEEQAEFLKRYA